MNTGANILYKILNWIQHIKGIIQYDQVEFSPGVQSWYTIWKPIKVIHRITYYKGTESIGVGGGGKGWWHLQKIYSWHHA